MQISNKSNFLLFLIHKVIEFALKDKNKEFQFLHYWLCDINRSLTLHSYNLRGETDIKTQRHICLMTFIGFK